MKGTSPMNLKQILKEKQLTQRDIFKRTGIAESTLSRAFRGGPIHKATLESICQVLEISVEDVTSVEIHSGKAAQAARRRQA